jgi:hypothetical protein
VSYYRNKSTGEEKVLLNKISNGKILTSFTEHGHALSNSSMQLFVTDSELKESWDKFEFSPKLDQSEEDLKFMKKTLRELLHEMNNYGLMFQNDMHIDEFVYCDGEYDLLANMLEADFSKYKNFEDYYHKEVSRSLSADDESEYGYSLHDVLSQTKVLLDCLKSVAKYYVESRSKK